MRRTRRCETGSVTIDIADCVRAVSRLTVSRRRRRHGRRVRPHRLFRPFHSTKGSKGMGIGAYQAREFALQSRRRRRSREPSRRGHALLFHPAGGRMSAAAPDNAVKPKLLVVEDDRRAAEAAALELRRIRSDRRGRSRGGARADPPPRAGGGAAGSRVCRPMPKASSEGMRTLKEILSLAPHTTRHRDHRQRRPRQRDARGGARRLRFLLRSRSTPTCCGSS